MNQPFTERDILLALAGDARKVWAERHLETPMPVADERALGRNQIALRMAEKILLPGPNTVDLRPVKGENPRSAAYQGRIFADG